MWIKSLAEGRCAPSWIHSHTFLGQEPGTLPRIEVLNFKNPELSKFKY